MKNNHYATLYHVSSLERLLSFSSRQVLSLLAADTAPYFSPDKILAEWKKRTQATVARREQIGVTRFWEEYALQAAGHPARQMSRAEIVQNEAAKK